MLIAQLSQDEAGLKAAGTERTLAMGKPSPPGKDHNIKLKPPQFEGGGQTTAVVPAELMVDAQPQELPFIVLKEPDGWKVDMPATMERMLGGTMEELTRALKAGMQQMAEGLKGVMEGMGEAMAKGF